MEELGVAELVPAYLDPNLKTEDLKTGVSFASGGCGFDPLTTTLAVIFYSLLFDRLKLTITDYCSFRFPCDHV